MQITYPTKQYIPRMNEEIIDDEEGLTLLDEEGRRELPKIPYKPGRPCYLPRLIKREPKRYTQLINYIRQGVYFHVAAEAVGISQFTMIRWGNKGKEDMEHEIDSYYSRFYRDVRRSVAICRSGCEVAIKELNPGKWLAKGPGRILGNQWSEERSSREDDTPLIESEEHKQLEDQTVEGTLHISNQQELEKLELLEQAGLLTLSEEYRKALKNQTSQENEDVVPS